MSKRKATLENIYGINYLFKGWPGVIKLAEAIWKEPGAITQTSIK
jgi:hypothetical protein